LAHYGHSVALMCDQAESGVKEVRSTADRLGLQVGPSPSDRQFRVSFRLTTATSVTALIVNPAGRVVRRLYQGQLGEGPMSMRWDGRDDQGRVQPAGIYFVRVQTPREASTRRVVLLSGGAE